MAIRKVIFSTNHLQVGDTVGTQQIISIRCERRKHFECKCTTCGRIRNIRSDHMSRYVGGVCECRPPQVYFGLSKVREFKIYKHMLSRCYNTKADNFRFYGGIGRYVCERWRESYHHFIADIGPAPSLGHTLDRIDSNGSYTCGHCEECRSNQQPANVRWATKYVQHRNQVSNRTYTHNGHTLILKDWARLKGMNYFTLHHRIELGWTFEDAINKPVRALRKPTSSENRE